MSFHTRPDGVTEYSEHFTMGEGLEDEICEGMGRWTYKKFFGSVHVIVADTEYSIVLTFPAGGEGHVEAIMERVLGDLLDGDLING
ncbi:MAG: hypothetical protein E6R03_02865 [Hyphomicrobiaceae bacterium]|nr:MAG: hypothetical protein E6R03_02865 [Hyphomicrobiaceae bacterium]